MQRLDSCCDTVGCWSMLRIRRRAVVGVPYRTTTGVMRVHGSLLRRQFDCAPVGRERLFVAAKATQRLAQSIQVTRSAARQCQCLRECRHCLGRPLRPQEQAAFDPNSQCRAGHLVCAVRDCEKNPASFAVRTAHPLMQWMYRARGDV